MRLPLQDRPRSNSILPKRWRITPPTSTRRIRTRLRPRACCRISSARPERFERLADQERETGALTGTTGAGSVVQLLVTDGGAAEGARKRHQCLARTGHLALRRGPQASGNDAYAGFGPRRDRSARRPIRRRSRSALTGVITSLEQTSIAPSVKRAAEDLSLGFIAPVADGARGRSRQPAGPGDGDRSASSVAAQSKVLSRGGRPDPVARTGRRAALRAALVRRSGAALCFRFHSRAGPAQSRSISCRRVLVFMLSIVHWRRCGARSSSLPFAERITAAELLQALEVQRAVQQRGVDLEAALAQAEKTETPDQSNIASFDLSGKGPRKGPPV